MSLAKARAELKEVEEKLERGVDIFQDLMRLGETIASDVGKDKVLQQMPRQIELSALAEKAQAARDLLRVGAIPLPADADRRLLALATRIADEPISKRLEEELEKEFATYENEARAAKEKVDDLKNDIDRLESQASMLEQYQQLLTFLESS